MEAPPRSKKRSIAVDRATPKPAVLWHLLTVSGLWFQDPKPQARSHQTKAHNARPPPGDASFNNKETVARPQRTRWPILMTGLCIEVTSFLAGSLGVFGPRLPHKAEWLSAGGELLLATVVFPIDPIVGADGLLIFA